MLPRITEIPFPDFKELAEKRYKQAFFEEPDNFALIDDFHWDNTPEGHEFWCMLNDFLEEEQETLDKTDLGFLLDILNI